MSRSKGNRIVREKAIPYYKDLGFPLVDKTEHIGRFRKSQDLFSGQLGEGYTDQGFDIICLKPEIVVFCQVKSNSPPTQKWYRDFAEMYASDDVRVECYTWYDYKGARIQQYLPDGTINEIDLR